jgi:hypothetical protein
MQKNIKLNNLIIYLNSKKIISIIIMIIKGILIKNINSWVTIRIIEEIIYRINLEIN